MSSGPTASCASTRRCVTSFARSAPSTASSACVWTAWGANPQPRSPSPPTPRPIPRSALPKSRFPGAIRAECLFPPLDQALIQAMACEVVAQTELPLSRQSLADLVGRARVTLGKEISRSTVWRMLHEAAIKPWQHEHWIFPRDPLFAEKAGPILDLYGGIWEGKPLGPKDSVLNLDE